MKPKTIHVLLVFNYIHFFDTSFYIKTYEAFSLYKHIRLQK